MKYKSEIFEVIHQSAVEKFKIGAITEAKMSEYNEMCLVSETETSVSDTVNEPVETEHTSLVTA